ncbi:hypothetical protein B0T26DRAFT_650064 [Lasiosphaeria miniovina]|uniref:RNA polymerase II subunit A C-terminal domain phosphatase n=1 Tax=Lasiosphaeria miniovina TaxID=1954250 RepID=A0AA40DU97_9PEZI|nr:uncharacterized protein B0T26DRAFT_650064 [Lasiosphaeria miniovina]KAK0713466.1 hypothetical protein B0T26DRAFT_650064 [Lasiosphaeria miniovina]
MSKTIGLGNRLRYPITIVELLKGPGETIKKQEVLMRYSFKWMKEVGDTIRGNTWQEEQTTIADWASPTDGELRKWHIKNGELIMKDGPCFVVKEACSHEIQFQGLCAMCGKDMTEVNWAAEARDTDRAPISMVHDQTNLTVSQFQATRAENDLQRRLLQQRKLSLVVDLDQTIIHACIDPTVAEWQRDPSNPNHGSVKAVQRFQLDDGPRGVTQGCWYFIKMRPGLEQFLAHVSELFELHVYTMGTRAYAQAVARIVDPEQKLFGNRVISRDENGNMYAKSLQRLFPVSTNMVLIIDDRADVWPRNKPNLIKVSPYDFFRGIGDINSSFLPKRQDALAPDAAAVTNGDSNPRPRAGRTVEASKASAAETLASAGDEADPELTQRQLEEQERTLEKQIKDRPLQLLQEKLDKEDEEAERASTQSEDNQEAPRSSPPLVRHQVLVDDDRELEFLEQHLTLLHKTYYEEYDRQRASERGNGDVELVTPDVGQLLDSLKSRALRGLRILLTGLVPTNVDIFQSEIGQRVLAFGADLRTDVSRDLTHVVVNSQRPWTKKLKRAARYPNIKIVNQGWLAACFSQWDVVDETPYLFHVHPDIPAAERLLASGGGADTETDASEADDTDGNAEVRPRGRILRLKRPKLKLVSASGETRTLDDGEESDDEDEAEAADADDLLPDEFEDGQLSPIDTLKTFNWGSADEELDEFLAGASDDDDDDDGDEQDEDDANETRKDEDFKDEDASETTDSEENRRAKRRTTPTRKRKRKLDESGASGKLRRAKSARGTSSLRNQYDISDSSLPTPADEDDASSQPKLPASRAQGAAEDGGDDGLYYIDEAELEADFMAEFEADGSVPQGEGLGVGKAADGGDTDKG